MYQGLYIEAQSGVRGKKIPNTVLYVVDRMICVGYVDSYQFKHFLQAHFYGDALCNCSLAADGRMNDGET